ILLPSRMPQSPGVNSDAVQRSGGVNHSRLSLFARFLKSGAQGGFGPQYYSIPAHWMCPGKRMPFGMYRKTKSGEVILSHEPNRIYVPADNDLLDENYSPLVFLKRDSRGELLYYLDKNLDEIISDPRMRPSEKAEVFYYLAYRRLRTAYKNPGKISFAGMKQLIALMIEQIMGDKETFRQVFLLIQDNICRTVEHPESAILHSLNVGILSTFFVSKVLTQLSRRIIEDISMGYFFHNIGMMRLPQKVANYKGTLNTAAWSIIKLHPAWGLEAVKGVQDTSRMMAHIIMDHHEKTDGGGYPKALKGDDIHFFVKVCSVMDTFDALISDRSYRHAINVVDALKQIKQKVPREYDPGIFTKLIRVFLENDLL
ncbi:HD domain-containing protein, partial [archaeon]|nr:HD domain-containing protein [archaeon]